MLLTNFPDDWEKTREKFVAGVHFKMKNLSEKQLQTWIKRVGMRFYAPHRIFLRSLRFFIVSHDITLAMYLAWVSFKARKWYTGI